MRWLAVIVLLLGSPALGQQILREGSTALIDLTFQDANGQGAFPTSLTWRLDDRLSRFALVSEQNVGTPSDQPCPSGATGCVTLTVPAGSAKIVGQCSNKEAYCLVNSDCGTGTCRVKADATREVVLTVRWTYSGGQGADAIPLKIKNLEF